MTELIEKRKLADVSRKVAVSVLTYAIDAAQIRLQAALDKYIAAERKNIVDNTEDYEGANEADFVTWFTETGLDEA